MSYSFSVCRFTDKEVVEKLKRSLGEDFTFVRFSLVPAIGHPLDSNQPNAMEEISQLLDEESVSCRSISVFYQEFDQIVEVKLSRGNQNGSSDAFYDKIEILLTGNQGPRSPSKLARLIKRLQCDLQMPEGKTLIDFAQEEDKAFYAARERSIQKLQEMQEEFFKKFEDYAIAQEERNNSKIEKIELRIAEKEKKLEEQYETRNQSLASREVAFAQKLKEFNDRNYMHERRETRQQMKKTFAERSKVFTLTPKTQRQRWWILIGYLILLVIIGSATGFSLLNSEAQSNLTGPYITRQIILSLAFAITAGFWLRWMGKWAQAHADEEFKLKRLELDIDRANWVVENALEWKTDKGSEIPQYLLERLSRNLFTEESTKESSMTAADALAMALLRSSNKLRMKLGDTELELDHSGVNKLTKNKVE